MNKLLKRTLWLLLFAPVAYLIVVWKKLPDTVPMHFDHHGNPDRYGNKAELWATAAIMTIAGIGTYLLITNIHRIDPKRYAREMQDKYDKIAATVVIFLSAIHFFIILSAEKGHIVFGSGLILAAVSVLLAVLGNYMYNIKPNYFVGIRIPWTLENEDNWKKTHNLAGRLWFTGGILMAILTALLPSTAGVIVFFTGIVILTIIPVVYSYRIFVRSKNNK